jgi:dTDP-4-dehydrorhamnose 3,5-epimerase
MQIEDTALEGVKLITPRRFGDHRGFFAETWNAKAFANLGIASDFVQDNHSLSAEVGTVRGLHFQAPPHAQAKLVRCGRGAIFDVAVDIRRGSATYGNWVGHELSEENGAQLFIPEGFAHGFVTLQPDSEIVYKCSDYYAPESEGAVRWNDPAIGIDWPLSGAAILSGKDAEAPLLADLDSPFSWEGAA